MSLRARVRMLVAATVVTVVGLEAYLSTRASERALDAELSDIAAITAQAVADEIQIGGGLDAADMLVDLLQDYRSAAPAVRDITVFAAYGQALDPVASTSSAVSAASLDSARQALEHGAPVWSVSETLRGYAVPFAGDAPSSGIVAVTVSLAALEQLRTHGRREAAMFGLVSIVVLIALVDLLAARIVFKPLADIGQVMARTSSGVRGIRVSVARNDEIGTLGAGLNRMLAEIERFNDELTARVEDATATIRRRNEELLERSRQLFLLRQELTRVEQLAALGQLAATFAHHIGTPLNLISAHVQLMIQQSGPRGRWLPRLRVMEGQVAKVAATVREMLAGTRRSSEIRTPVDVAEIAERVVDLTRPMCTAAGLRVAVVSKSEVPIVLGDRHRLELVLLNLLSNSLDATAPGGRIEITLDGTTNTARLRVSDTGRGIPADLRSRVFEHGFTTKPPGKGSGLGLSIAREIVSEHGGTIGVESEPGEGATFVLELPAASRVGTTSGKNPGR